MSVSRHHRSDYREAILFAAWPDLADPLADLGDPAICQPMLGKPLLLRAIEGIVRLGCRHIRVVIDGRAEAVRSLLQDGERWGCQLSYHDLSAPSSLGAFMRGLDINAMDDILVADAWHVPECIDAMDDLAAAPGVVICWNKGDTRSWMGWGCLSGAWLLSRSAALSRANFERLVLEDDWLLQRSDRAPLCAMTASRFLDSSARLLSAASDTGSVIDHEAFIHPEARIVPPVFIGSRARIGAGAVIGPLAIVEAGAFIDRGSFVSNAVILPDTYLGEDLNAECAVIRGDKLANIPLDIVTTIPDRSLACDSSAPAQVISGRMRSWVDHLLQHWRRPPACLPAGNEAASSPAQASFN